MQNLSQSAPFLIRLTSNYEHRPARLQKACSLHVIAGGSLHAKRFNRPGDDPSPRSCAGSNSKSPLYECQGLVMASHTSFTPPVLGTRAVNILCHVGMDGAFSRHSPVGPSDFLYFLRTADKLPCRQTLLTAQHVKTLQSLIMREYFPFPWRLRH